MTLSRRDFAAGLLAAPAILKAARAAPLPNLPNMAGEDATFAAPGSTLYDATLPAYNLRTELKPSLRILVRTEQGLRQALDWVRDKDLAFALRSGGHSYEGFSQSTGVVIDTRLMNAIAFDETSGLLSAGAGASLGDIYRAVAPHGYGFPGGSCPTVGVSGHVLGGGFGFLARDRGLACDSLVGIDLVSADAKPIQADASQNPDLLWASQGGGGGTFGAATRFHFQLRPVGPVAVYSATWLLRPSQAAKQFALWQDWAPHAPDAITGFLEITKHTGGLVALHIAGQSTGSAAQLRDALRALSGVAALERALRVEPMSYLGAINHFSGGWAYETEYTKGKSDFITTPLDGTGIDTLIGGIAALPAGEVVASCDSHGGALGRIADDATAFAYRAGTQYCIQYYTSWRSTAAGLRHQAGMRSLYAAMRPWSGGSYVNYCDLDLDDWRKAYWRQNLPRLQAVKAKYDPGNVFHHGQSV